MAEHMRYVGEHSLGALNCATIRKQQIAACLEAMLSERRFTYTDLFLL